MENSLPALIIGAILLVATSLMARGSLQSYDQLGSSVHALQTRVFDQTQTRLSVPSATLNPTRDTLSVQLRNEGQTRLAAYDRIDVIVTYYTDATTQTSTWLPYTDTTPAAMQWSIASITPDAIDPGILNPGETADIEIVLDPPVTAGKTGTIVIGAETGATVTASFTS